MNHWQHAAMATGGICILMGVIILAKLTWAIIWL